MKPFFNFSRWLEGRRPGSAKKFHTNFLKFYTGSYHNLNDFLNRGSKKSYLSAFDWCNTEEGEEYWGSLERQWNSPLTFLHLQDYTITFSIEDPRLEKDIKAFSNTTINQFKEELV
jgi:hypothetical protein